MDQDYTSPNINIEELVKTSKQLQNKMRQELHRQAKNLSSAALSDVKAIPPIWDQIMLSPYVKNVVADYLVDTNYPTGGSLTKKLAKQREKSMREELEVYGERLGQRECVPAARTVSRPQGKQTCKDTRKQKDLERKRSVAEEMSSRDDIFRTRLAARALPRQVKKTGNLATKGSVVSFEKTYRSVETQASTEVGSRNLHTEGNKSTAKTSSRSKLSSGFQRSASKSSRNISFADVKEPSIKTPVSGHRYSLQRFIGSSKSIIDFAKEHPNLELDTTTHQRSVFPRRIYKEFKVESPPEPESANLASTKIRKPEVEVPHKDETWKALFMKNRPPSERPVKVVHLKKNVNIVESAKEKSVPERSVPEPKEKSQPVTSEKSLLQHKEKSVPVPEAKPVQPIGIDVISTPYRGLFHLEKQNDPSVKQKKHNLQRLPVLYIRPECQVQRVTKISIYGDGDAKGDGADDYFPNVKYVEFVHGVSNEVPTAATEATVKSKEPPGHDIAADDNKYFKAFEFTESSKNLRFEARSASRSPSKSSEASISETSAATTYLRSLSKALHSSSPSSMETFENDMPTNGENDLTPPHRRSPTEELSKPTQQQIIKSPSLRDMCIQTDPPTEKPAMPQATLQTAPTSREPTNPIVPETKTTHQFSSVFGQSGAEIGQGDSKFIEDDFISQIFERIRNDIPQAVQAFKARNLPIPQDQPVPAIRVHKEHQATAISKPSNVNLLPKSRAAVPEASIEVKRHDGIGFTVVQKSLPATSITTATAATAVKTLPPGANGDEGLLKFSMAQQNALFEQSINKIKSSAVRDGMSGDVRIKEDRHKYPTDAEVKRAVKIFLDSLTLDDGGDEGGRKSNAKGADVRRKLTFPMAELQSRRSTSKYINPFVLSSNGSSSSSSKKKDKTIRKLIGLNRCDMSESSSSTMISSSDLELGSDIDCEPSNKTATNSLSEGEVRSVGEV